MIDCVNATLDFHGFRMTKLGPFSPIRLLFRDSWFFEKMK